MHESQTTRVFHPVRLMAALEAKSAVSNCIFLCCFCFGLNLNYSFNSSSLCVLVLF